MEARSEMGKKENNTKSTLSIIMDLLKMTKPKGISSYELDDARTPEERQKVFDRFTKK